ncbi:hypothetical protein [Geoglobus acetivorans]|uniref:Uncharacterized protein n=1 Tax=Geoglobus acetivorans TaxID=565033 RepID=A0ABZ3H7Q2_GEOAI|nr:hypothetical protein [Geoglobus acetivorans]
MSQKPVEEIRTELKEEYPDIDFDDDLLAIVGSIPPNPPEMDRVVLRRAVEKVMGWGGL